MSHFVRKPVFGVSDKVGHKPGCTTTEDGVEARNSRGVVVKTKALISCAVTTELIGAFYFLLYVKNRFSHDPAHF